MLTFPTGSDDRWVGSVHGQLPAVPARG